MDLLRIGIHLARDLGTKRLPFRTAINFINHLDEDSAVARARREFRPNMDTQLLRQVEYWTHLLSYRDTKAAQQKKDIPKPVKLYGDDLRKPGQRDPREFERKMAARAAKRQAELEKLHRG